MIREIEANPKNSNHADLGKNQKPLLEKENREPLKDTNSTKIKILLILPLIFQK